MNTGRFLAGRRWWLLLPLFFVGCAQPFVPIGKPHKVSVTLPCAVEKSAQPVVLKVSVGEITEVEAGTGNRALTFNTLKPSKVCVKPQPLVIPAGQRSGSVDITILDPGYVGHHFVVIFEEASPCPPGRFPYLGVTSFAVQPKPCAEKSAAVPQAGTHHRGRHGAAMSGGPKKGTTPIGPK